MRKVHSVSLLLLGVVLVTACAQKQQPADQVPSAVSGAKSALFALQKPTLDKPTRPGGPLGVFVQLSLGNTPENSGTALEGIETHTSLISDSPNEGIQEAFAILQEFGGLLQIDVFDVLDKSPDREIGLNQIIKTLKSKQDLMEKSLKEIEETALSLKEEDKSQTGEVRTLKREIKDALKEDNFTYAGTLQMRLTEAEIRLAEVDTQKKQWEDMKKRFEKVITLGQERIESIEENREILLSGLRVVDVPGIEDIGILERK